MENGYEIINNLFVRKSIEHEVIVLTEDCIGLVAGVKPLTPRVMDVVLQLKCISRVGVGMDSVDLDYTKEKGIVVINTPEGSTCGDAELTL